MCAQSPCHGENSAQQQAVHVQAAELFFLFSSALQWWLIAGAGMTLDHLAWAVQPGQRVPFTCLPQLFAPQLVFSAAHRATRRGATPPCLHQRCSTCAPHHGHRPPHLPQPARHTMLPLDSQQIRCAALAGQAMGSLVLTAAVSHLMLSGRQPLLLEIILMIARLIVAACNVAFLWEALHARRMHSATRCPYGSTSAALDSELFLLASCLLLLVWQMLHTWVSGGSVVRLAVLVSVHCGGASLLRAFGAILLLWGAGTRLSDSAEAHKVHAQLKAWCPHHLMRPCQEGCAVPRPTQGEGANFAADYIAAVVTVAADLVAPCALSRARTLQAISGCRASLDLIARPRRAAEDAAVEWELQRVVRTPCLSSLNSALYCTDVVLSLGVSH